MILLTWFTVLDGISPIVWQTIARHCSYRMRVEYCTLGIDTARSDFLAWIHAFSVDARMLRWTFVVVAATHCKE